MSWISTSDKTRILFNHTDPPHSACACTATADRRLSDKEGEPWYHIHWLQNAFDSFKWPALNSTLAALHPTEVVQCSSGSILRSWEVWRGRTIWPTHLLGHCKETLYDLMILACSGGRLHFVICHTRQHSRLYHQSTCGYLKTHMIIPAYAVSDLDFVDDIALPSQNHVDPRTLLTAVEQEHCLSVWRSIIRRQSTCYWVTSSLNQG